MQDAGEDVNPTAAFTPPPQDARTTNTTNTRQNNDAMPRATVPYRRVTSPEEQKELEATAKALEKEGKHYRFGYVEEGFLPLTQLISVERKETIEFRPGYYSINARTGKLSGMTSNWGSSAGEAVSCMCRVKGSLEDFESRPGFKKSHLALAAVWPDKPINNVDHIDGDYYNNSVFNLDNVSRGENSARKNRSDKGKEASNKSAATRSHRYYMLDAAGRVLGVYTAEEARIRLKKTGKHTHISEAAKSGGCRFAYGYYWERFNPGPTREALVGGPPRIIVYFDGLDGLPDRYKKQIKRVLGKGRRPPKAFSNYGEVMTNLNNWTVGAEEKRKGGAKTRSACAKLMHHWMILAFHPDRDEVDRWINEELEILHNDGDENNPEKYHRSTHEDGDDSKPYTNYYFTLRLGTRAENQGDRRAKDSRAPKKRRLNSDIAS